MNVITSRNSDFVTHHNPDGTVSRIGVREFMDMASVSYILERPELVARIKKVLWSHNPSRAGLTRKQTEILAYIEQRLDHDGIPPSFEEMKQHLGLRSKSGVHRMITALEERGHIRRLPNRARAIEIIGRAPVQSRLPLPAPGAVHIPIRREIYSKAVDIAKARQQPVEDYIEEAVNAFVEVDGE